MFLSVGTHVSSDEITIGHQTPHKESVATLPAGPDAFTTAVVTSHSN